MTYSYIVHVVAVAQVEVANEVAAVVLRITVGCRHTHWTHLEGARGHRNHECVAVSTAESFKTEVCSFGMVKYFLKLKCRDKYN